MEEKQMKRNADVVQFNAYAQQFMDKYKEVDTASGVLLYTTNLERNEQKVITQIGDINMVQIGHPSINKDLAIRYIVDDTKRQLEESVNNGMMTEEEAKSLMKGIGFITIKAMIDGFDLKSEDIDLNELKKDYTELLVREDIDTDMKKVVDSIKIEDIKNYCENLIKNGEEEKLEKLKDYYESLLNEDKEVNIEELKEHFSIEELLTYIENKKEM